MSKRPREDNEFGSNEDVNLEKYVSPDGKRLHFTVPATFDRQDAFKKNGPRPAAKNPDASQTDTQNHHGNPGR